MSEKRNRSGPKVAAWGEKAALAAATLAMEPREGIPAHGINLMDVPLLEEVAGAAPGDYAADPERVYLRFQRAAGVGFIDQFIPRNPLTMTPSGFDRTAAHGASTGAAQILLDGIVVDGPEAVARHLEQVVFPALETAIREADGWDVDARAARLVAGEKAVQNVFGNDLLKVPYSAGFQAFPHLRYTTYGYVHYFSAYALFPELMERDFALQAELALRANRVAAAAVGLGGLPAVIRLDHDMADSRGTLAGPQSLDRLWFPHFERAIRPFVDAGIRLLWHCDGNLMDMVPRLIACGVAGFQGFQYEDGMDYEWLCRQPDREGNPLMIWAGVSVTTTLPRGTPGEVRDQMAWLVENGPPVGLVLGASSSITPGLPRENLLTFLEGLAYYRERRHAC